MCTVPAQIFCAPTRAALIAAARFMPGVCAVLGSSWSPLITRTPLCRQSTVPGGRGVVVMVVIWLMIRSIDSASPVVARCGPFGNPRRDRAPAIANVIAAQRPLLPTIATTIRVRTAAEYP